MSYLERLRESLLGGSESGQDVEDPMDYQATSRAVCPDCGPCLADCFAGTWKCGKCGDVLDAGDLGPVDEYDVDQDGPEGPFTVEAGPISLEYETWDDVPETFQEDFKRSWDDQ